MGWAGDFSTGGYCTSILANMVVQNLNGSIPARSDLWILSLPDKSRSQRRASARCLSAPGSGGGIESLACADEPAFHFQLHELFAAIHLQERSTKRHQPAPKICGTHP